MKDISISAKEFDWMLELVDGDQDRKLDFDEYTKWEEYIRVKKNAPVLWSKFRNLAKGHSLYFLIILSSRTSLSVFVFLFDNNSIMTLNKFKSQILF